MFTTTRFGTLERRRGWHHARELLVNAAGAAGRSATLAAHALWLAIPMLASPADRESTIETTIETLIQTLGPVAQTQAAGRVE